MCLFQRLMDKIERYCLWMCVSETNSLRYSK
jgi:hypothetical protein